MSDCIIYNKHSQKQRGNPEFQIYLHIHTVLYNCTLLLAQLMYLYGKGIADRGTKFNLACSQLNKNSPE